MVRGFAVFGVNDPKVGAFFAERGPNNFSFPIVSYSALGNSHKKGVEKAATHTKRASTPAQNTQKGRAPTQKGRTARKIRFLCELP
jgi:hypothetical protein